MKTPPPLLATHVAFFLHIYVSEEFMVWEHFCTCILRNP